MPEGGTNPGTPQFGTAEYSGVPGTERCRFCNQAVAGRYFRVNGAMTCPSCAELAQRQVPQDSHAAYMRGLLFGVGAAILGLIGYAAFGIMTGLRVGYVSLAVGYIVGKAILMGSKGLGGRRYQITAVLLTYAAVSLAAVPMAISQFSKQKPSQEQQLQTEQRQLEKESGQEHQEPAATPKMSLGAALGSLALLGLASPFLELQDPFHGLIGLVILFVGLQIAWKITAGKAVEVSGPFDNPAPAS
jgi:phage FluMu protein Com